MNNSINQTLNGSVDSSKKKKFLSPFQVKMLKLSIIIVLFISIAFLNLFAALTFAAVTFCLKCAIFCKELSDFDCNFTLDNDDMKEINAQLWK